MVRVCGWQLSPVGCCGPVACWVARRVAFLMSLSGILCVRHSMTTRSMYAKQDEVEERGHCGQVGGAAVDPEGTD